MSNGPRLVFDIETDGLLIDVTKIHCIATYDLDTGEEQLYSPLEVDEGLKALSEASLLVGHNICGYDIPAIRLLNHDWETEARLVDTLLLGCILYPDDRIMSLEAWAKRLKLPDQKVENEDWSVYTKHMGVRCQSDVRINTSVYNELLGNAHCDMTEVALETEQGVAIIHAAQTLHGVSFNVAHAILLLQELDKRIAVSRAEIMDMAPWTCNLVGVPKKWQKRDKIERKADVDQNVVPKGTCTPFKANGTYNVATKKYFGEEYKKVRGHYSKVDIKPINPDSSEEVKKLLLGLGWVPTEWNFKKEKDGSFAVDRTGQRIITSPKLTEDSYDSLPPGLGKKIAEYNTMNHRRNFLLNKKDKSKGALAAVHQRGDGMVTADAFTCGTNTGRYRHSGTVCNIPRPSSPWGKEIRSLFKCTDGNKMVGVDLSGIEARMLAHYLLLGNYTDAQKTVDLILSPDKGNDFHSYNAKQWGVSRDTAKSGLYALMYGAGAKKLAQTLGYPDNKGAKLKREFYKAHPGIKELVEDLEAAYQGRGFLLALDGRPLYIRQVNKLLNTLLQNAAAIVFKRWMIRMAEVRQAVAAGSHVNQTIAYHDELQFDCDEGVAKAWGKRCELEAIEVGKELNIEVPIEAEAKTGYNWGETH